MSPLEISCSNGYEEIGLILLAKTSIDELENSTINMACSFREEKFDFVKEFFDKLKNSNEERIRMYFFKNPDLFVKLIDNNHLKIIEYVLKEFGNHISAINNQDTDDLIHLAAKNGSTDLLKILVKFSFFFVEN